MIRDTRLQHERKSRFCYTRDHADIHPLELIPGYVLLHEPLWSTLLLRAVAPLPETSLTTVKDTEEYSFKLILTSMTAVLVIFLMGRSRRLRQGVDVYLEHTPSGQKRRARIAPGRCPRACPSNV